jgi:glycosyltransferase involved in cell wall biosynthesis
VRIALLCPSLGEYGGIGRIAEALAREFRAAGHEVAFVSRPRRTPGALPSPPEHLEIPMHQLPRRWHHLARQARLAATLLGTLPRLRAFLCDRRMDVLLVLSISTYAPLALAASRWLPIVVSLQGGEPDGRFTAHPRIFRLLLVRAAAVTACASSLGRQALSLAPQITGRLDVVPNGVDLQRFSDVAPYVHERPYVLAAGRFTPQKAFDVLIDAAGRVPAIRSGRAAVLIAGDGAEEDRLRRRVSELGLDDAVSFLGPVDAAGMSALYRGATMVAVPSRWEGLPLVCLEAMASGRAVVASRVDGIPDAVLDGETGVLVPPDDAGALAGALDSLLGDGAWTERLGAAGMRRVRETFAWPIVAHQYLGVLARATAGSRP